MTPPIRTRAEAQAIMAFVARALARCYEFNASLDHAVQVELDILAGETSVVQPFDRIVPLMIDEHTEYAGGDVEL